eukprot:gene24111-30418_t
MLVVRLLTRDIFIKKARIDEYFIAKLAHILKPQVDIYILKKKTDEEEEEFYSQQNNTNETSPTNSRVSSPQNSTAVSTANNSIENLQDLLSPSHANNMSSVSRTNSPQSTQRRPLTSNGSAMSSSSMMSGGSGKKGKQLSAVDYLQNWRVNTLPKLLDPHMSSTDFTFMELLQYIGDNHMQSIDVTEQLLLLIAHIANKSQLNKYLLVEANIQPIVQRVRDGQVDNVYFMALSEICLELMEV